MDNGMGMIKADIKRQLMDRQRVSISGKIKYIEKGKLLTMFF